MFDRESKIKAWRREVQSFCQGNRCDLDELEDHLREEIATLTRAGRAEQDAWTAALAKLGDPAVLRREFAKIHRLPMLDRIAFGAMLSAAALIVAACGVILIARGDRILNQPVITVHVVTITLGYLAGLFAAVFASYAALRGSFAEQNNPALSAAALKLIRFSCVAATVFTLVGFTCGAIWSNNALGKPFNLDPREIGALIVVASFLTVSIVTIRNMLSTHFAMAVAIAAGATVILAWFGIAAHNANYPPLLTTMINVLSLAVLAIVAMLSLKARNDAAIG
jgi:hypothetical protein